MSWVTDSETTKWYLMKNRISWENNPSLKLVFLVSNKWLFEIFESFSIRAKKNSIFFKIKCQICIKVGIYIKPLWWNYNTNPNTWGVQLTEQWIEHTKYTWVVEFSTIVWKFCSKDFININVKNEQKVP